MEIHLLQIVVIGLTGFLAQWVAWKINLPAIVFLLLTGFLLGPVLQVIRPSLLLGDLFHSAISIAIAVILFEASLGLNFREIREFRRSVRHIVLIGSPAAWLLGSVAGHYVAGLSWPVAVTFGGLLVVTGPTVILPLLRSARLFPRTGSILKWEGIVNDPLGILFSVMGFEYFVYAGSHTDVGFAFYAYFLGILAATCLTGAGLAKLVALILKHGWIPEYLKSYFLFIIVIALFSVCNIVLDELGLLAVTIFGIVLSNIHVSSLAEIRRFKETVTLFFVTGVFILLTADLNPSVLLDIGFRDILFILCLLLVVRPISIALSSVGTGMKLTEVAMISWVAPRGVVCAAIAGVMGPRLVEAGFEDGERLLPLAFTIVIVTVVLHGLTVKPLAKRLGLAVKEAGGLIIVGSYPWTVQLAALLKSKDVPVLIADTNWHHLKAARLADIPVFYGEILSEEANYAIDHGGFGSLLAATDNSAYNSLVCNDYATDFGRERVWQLATPEDTGAERKKVSTMLQGQIFVSPDLFHDVFENHNWTGSKFKATKIGPAESNAHEPGILSREGDLKIGVIRNNTLQFNSPGLDAGAREGDTLLWLEMRA